MSRHLASEKRRPNKRLEPLTNRTTLNRDDASPRRTCASSAPWLAAGTLFAVLAAVSAKAEDSTNLASLSFEQLSQIQVVTASKRPESVSDIPAAVHVLSNEDMLRSGATTIPEALRYVPGLNVAQINGSAWSIGARGFQAQYASKLLVMIDGRSVYTPLFGGIYWDVQDYLLEDLEQIEVVLGPGSSIWGANAFNGVINVITKSARDTQGTLLYGGGGNEKLGMAGGRYGWRLGETTFARAYVKYSATDDLTTTSGADNHDAVQDGQGGFRVDGYEGEQSHWTLQGDAYAAGEGYRADLPSLTAPNYMAHAEETTRVSGANALGRWELGFSEDSILRAQAYYDYAQRASSFVDARVHTLDLELHHSLLAWERHQMDYGLGYRLVYDEVGDAWATLDPNHSNSQLFSGFVQDKFWLARDVLSLTGGIKLEHNDYTGLEPQPSGRLDWHPTKNHTIWGGLSRAVRVPTLMEVQGSMDARVYPPGTVTPGLPSVLRIFGSDNLGTEQLTAWEMGWRWQAMDRLSFDLSGYYYNLDRLILNGLNSPYLQSTPGPAVILPAPFDNGLTGEAYGGELAATWQPLDIWRLRAGYGYVQMQLHPYKPDPINYEGDEGTTPHHSAFLRSSLNLGRDWDFDLGLRFVDEVPYYQVSSYVELDLRLAWRPRPNLELAVGGQNLAHSQHQEYKPALVGQPSQLERSVYAKVTWKF